MAEWTVRFTGRVRRVLPSRLVTWADGFADERGPLRNPAAALDPAPSDYGSGGGPDGGPGGRFRWPQRPDGGRLLDAAIGDCGVYEGGRRRPGRVSLGEGARVARGARGSDGFVWVGLQQAGAEDIEAVAAEFELPFLAVQDAVKAHQRPKVEVYDDVVFVVLKPVDYVDHDEVIELSELAIFVGPHFVVTVRHGNSRVLARVRGELDSDSRLALPGPIGVLYRAADLVVDGYEAAVEQINEDVDQIESEVFGESDDNHSERIYKLKREVAEFRRAVQPLAPALQRLADGAVPGVSPEAAPYFRDVHDHVLRASDAIEAHDRLLSDVLAAELARVAARQSELAAQQSRIAVEQNEIAVRQNEDMRKISAWAAIALVPTAIAGIYGMNFDNMPELHQHYGYYVVLGVIATTCVVLHRLFRSNGWL